MHSISVKNVNSRLFFIVLICIILYFGKSLLVPVTFSALFAMLMTPMSNKLEEKGVKRVPSTIISVFVFILSLAAIVGLIIAQAISMSEDFPMMQTKFEKFYQEILKFAQQQFNLSEEQVKSMIEKQTKAMGSSGSKFLTTFFSNLTSTLGSLVLSFVFMFLFLLQRDKYEVFFLKLIKNNNPDETRRVLQKASKVVQKYLLGRVFSIIILTVLYFIALISIGVKNAFLLSAIAALATVIPYVGTIAGSLFPFFMALITEDSITPAIAVLAAIFVIQTIDNYFIEPYVVGGEVNISAFFTIVGILAGGLIWGVAGIILFLPMLGIIKIVMDHINTLEPYAYLIGDQKEEGTFDQLLKKLKDRLSKKN